MLSRFGSVPTNPALPWATNASSGPDIVTLQQDLNSIGYTTGSDGTTGNYGMDTSLAVAAFQQANSITTDSPGLTDQTTWSAIETASPQVTTVPSVDYSQNAPSTTGGTVGGTSSGAGRSVVSTSVMTSTINWPLIIGATLGGVVALGIVIAIFKPKNKVLPLQPIGAK